MSKTKSQTASTTLTVVAFSRLLTTTAVFAGLALSFSQLAQAQTVSQKFGQTVVSPAASTDLGEITISDLANAQKLKLKDEILKAQGLPTQQERVAAKSQPAVVAKAVKPLPTPVYEAPISVHAIYTIKKGDFIVELTDGRNLLNAKTGARFGNRVITDVTNAGVLVNRTDCKGKCDADRLVTVGGKF